ncbi:hypothetical protein AB0L82_03270 [Nocardia sp. NPDC052001]
MDLPEHKKALDSRGLFEGGASQLRADVIDSIVVGSALDAPADYEQLDSIHALDGMRA